MSDFRTIVIFCILSLCGLAVIPHLTVVLVPISNPNRFTISFSVLDASPEKTESIATSPIENAIAQVEGIKSINSISRQGSGSIEIGFDRHVDMTLKRFELSTILRNLYPKLSPGISFPLIENRSMQSESKRPVLIYSINAPFTPYQIKEVARDLFTKPISQLPGVREMNISGASELQISIEYDTNGQPGIQTHDLILKSINQNVKEKYLSRQKTSSGQYFNVKTNAEINEIEQLGNSYLLDSSRSVMLRDIAFIYLEEQSAQAYFRINGLNSINLTIYTDDRVNKIVLSTQLKNLVNDVSKKLPVGYSLFLEHDETAALEKEVNKNYFRSALSLLALIAFIIVTYRKVKDVLILVSGLVITISVTLLLCWFFNIAIHLYTIAGLSVSFGMIVDNAILVLDQLRRAGKNKVPYQSIIGASLTTITALLLVFALPEGDRLNTTEFCAIVSLILTVSVPISVFFVPAAHSFLRRATDQKIRFKNLRQKIRFLLLYERAINFGARYKKACSVIAVLCFGTPLFMLPSRIENYDWYNKTVGSELYQDQIRPYVDKLTGGTLRIFVRHVYERSGYREPERTKLYVHGTLPPGHTLDDMNSVIQGMELFLKNTHGIEKFITHVSSPEDASIVIYFTDDQQNGSLPYRLKNRLIVKSLDWGGVEWGIYGVGQGFSNSSGDNLPSFRVKMKGYNYDELEHQSNILANKLLAHKRIQKVNTNDRFNWEERKTVRPALELDPKALAGQGFSVRQVVKQLQYQARQNDPAFSLVINNQRLPVALKEKRPIDLTLFEATQQSLYLKNQYLNLNAASRFSQQEITPSIRREDRQYVRMVGFEYYGSSKFGDEFLTATLEEMKIEMPVGYTSEKQTYGWDWDKAKHQYGLLALLFLGIYITCLVLFGNFRQPLTVLVVIPISFIGLFLTFSWFEFYFDQGGYAAFILLGGLTVNASIYVINEFNNQRKRRITKAAFVKGVPISLTVLSTCFGLLPFLWGGQNEVFWFSLAVGTMGGMLFSMIGVFIIGPILIAQNPRTVRTRSLLN